MGKREVVLAEPSGFCAGVEAALKSLAWLVVLNPPPVACVHAVVHNEEVVARFEALGVQFLDRPDEAPPGAAVLLSAHGSAPDTAARSHAAHVVVDAACPLVTKVHREMRARSLAGDAIVYLGHAGHDEAEGAIAHSLSRVYIVEHAGDVNELPIASDAPVSVLAQTTVAAADWHRVVERAQERFSATWTPRHDDVCFATTNRQEAVLALAAACSVVVVVGSSTSSNTGALVRTAREGGARHVHRVRGPDELPVLTADRVGVVAGASTPRQSVDAVVRALHGDVVRTLRTAREDAYFPLAAGVRRQIDAAIDAGALPPELIAMYRNDRLIRSEELLDVVAASTAVGSHSRASMAR